MHRQTEWLLRTTAYVMLVIGGCLNVAGIARRSALLLFTGSTIATVAVGILVGLVIYWHRHPTLQLKRMTRPNDEMSSISEKARRKEETRFHTKQELSQMRERDGIEQHAVLDEHGELIDENDPVARAVNAAWRSGKTIIWNEGDPLP